MSPVETGSKVNYVGEETCQRGVKCQGRQLNGMRNRKRNGLNDSKFVASVFYDDWRVLYEWRFFLPAFCWVSWTDVAPPLALFLFLLLLLLLLVVTLVFSFRVIVALEITVWKKT